ncbi:hypothetical protein GEMRC1_001618 [Eukaryota sp. GEM-RC1]
MDSEVIDSLKKIENDLWIETVWIETDNSEFDQCIKEIERVDPWEKIGRQITDTCNVTDIVDSSNETTDLEKFISNCRHHHSLNTAVFGGSTSSSCLRVIFSEIFCKIERFQHKIRDFITIADSFELSDEVNVIQEFKDSLPLSNEKLSNVLANPISTVITQIVSAFLNDVKFDDNFLLQLLLQRSLLRLYSVISILAMLLPVQTDDEVVKESFEEDQDGNVPAGSILAAAAATISQQILQFIAQLLEPDVKASHLESIYSSFKEEEMSNEMEFHPP